jgi:hypothetical protein
MERLLADAPERSWFYDWSSHISLRALDATAVRAHCVMRGETYTPKQSSVVGPRVALADERLMCAGTHLLSDHAIVIALAIGSELARRRLSPVVNLSRAAEEDTS